MKPPTEAYVLVLQPSTPPECLTWLEDYIYENASVPKTLYIACSEVVVHHPFVHLTAIKSDDQTWKILLPIQYVLLIMDWPDKETLPVGFQASPAKK
jgi:hypothetical protein